MPSPSILDRAISPVMMSLGSKLTRIQPKLSMKSFRCAEAKFSAEDPSVNTRSRNPAIERLETTTLILSQTLSSFNIFHRTSRARDNKNHLGRSLSSQLLCLSTPAEFAHGSKTLKRRPAIQKSDCPPVSQPLRREQSCSSSRENVVTDVVLPSQILFRQ